MLIVKYLKETGISRYLLSVIMAGEVVVDALPYIDQGYDEPGVREAVSRKYSTTERALMAVYCSPRHSQW